MAKNENIFQSIFEQCGKPIAIIEKDIACEIFNEEFKNLIGIGGNDSFERIEIGDLFSNDIDFVKFKEKLLSLTLKNSKEKTDEEYRIKTLKGDDIDVKISLSPITGTKKIIAIFENLTESIKEETERKKCEQKLKNIVTGNPIPQFVIDANNKIIFWNTAMVELTGISPNVAEGKEYPWYVFYNDERPCMADLVLTKNTKELDKYYGPNQKPANKSHFSYSTKVFLPKLNKWASVSATQILDSDGNPNGAFETIEDITMIIEAEESLKTTNRQMEEIIEFLPDATFIIDRDNKVRAWNRAIEDMTGVAKKDIIGKEHDQVTIPFYGYSRKFLVDYLDIIHHPDEEYNFLERRRDSIFGEAYAPNLFNGKGAFIWAIASYLKNDKGEVIGAIESVRDISRYKIAEAALKVSEESYRSLYDNNPSMYFTIDADGIVLSVNKFGCEALGYSLEELVGESVLKVFYHNDKQKALEKAKLCIDNLGHVFYWELRKVRKNGSMLWVKETARALLNTEGKVIIFIVCEDITEQKSTEKALIESEKRYKELYDDNPSMYFTLAPDGIVLSVNHFGCQQLGYSATELIGHPVLKVFQEEDKEKASSFLKMCVNNIGRVYNWELRKIRKNGQLLWVKETGRALMNNDRVVVFIVCEDITEKKRAEEHLQESERKYRQLVDNSFLGIYSVQKEKIKFCNQKFADYFGYPSPEAVIGLSYLNMFTNESRAMFQDKLELNRLDLNEAAHYEVKCRRKDGSIFDAEIIASRILNEGRPSIQGTIIDISERKKSEIEIKKLSRAVEQNPSCILIADLNGNIEYVNPSFEKITGYNLSEVKGQNFRTLKNNMPLDYSYTEMWNTIIKRNEWRGEIRSNRKNGEMYWESVSVSAIKNDKGDITHFISVEEDITEKKELELELKRAIDRAEESIRLKTSLLSNMSHELRTPLTGILGLSQILMEELTESHFYSLIKKIYFSGKRLMITLNSILDLSEIESNATLIRTGNYDIAGEITYLLTQYNLAAKEKGLTFDIEIKDKKLVAFVDERLCNQILYNLVDNAIKYTIRGGIKIIVESLADEDKKLLGISVIDSGIGIVDENIPLIFEEFRQVSEGYNRSFEGAGLGLTLVKKMLTLLNGSIMVESTIGEGSKFTVLLPAVDNIFSVEEEEVEVFSATTASNKNEPFVSVLLVEDNEINMEVIKCYIESFCDVDNSYNGPDAIKMASRKKYDIILMDINLGSDMDGIEATKEIRKLPGYQNTPVVAITGYALSGDKERLIAEGLTHYLPKPFEKEELQKLLKGIIES